MKEKHCTIADKIWLKPTSEHAIKEICIYKMVCVAINALVDAGKLWMDMNEWLTGSVVSFIAQAETHQGQNSLLSSHYRASRAAACSVFPSTRH